MEKKAIGVIGGMGPLATVDIFRKIVLHTRAQTDQEHLRVLIDNNTAIPDRTEALALYDSEDQTADGYKFGYRHVAIADTYKNKRAGIYLHHKPKA